jgi:nucleoside-diphosphate-sugar epimerase
MNKIILEDLQLLHSNLKDFKDKIKGKTFLITGGAGFLGSWFCDVVIGFDGKVICIDNLSSGSKKNIEHLIGNKNFKLIEQDFLNYNPIEKIDYIVHMASIATPPLYMKFPIETLESNITGTKKLLDFALKNQVKGILFMSTSEIYGNPPDSEIPTKETFHGIVNSFGPRCMYDEGKRAAEAYCYSYFHKHKLPIRVSRTFNTYGPRLDVESPSQYGRSLIKFVHQAVNGNPITVYGDGNQTRSFCYITDQIEGLFKLLLMPGVDGEVFNIGNPKEFKILEMANMVVKASKSKSKVTLGSPANYNLKDDPKRRCPDITKANKMLDYTPKINLEQGLIRVIEWMEVHR